MKLKLSNASSPRGATLGRPNVIPDGMDRNQPIKLHMSKLKWVDFDYDVGGAYWGHTFRPDPSVKTTRGVYQASEDVHCAYSLTSDIEIYVRAINRKEAKELVRQILPGALFLN